MPVQSIDGYPNLISRVDAITGAETNLVLATVAAGTRAFVMSMTFICSKANTLNTTFRIGFGASSVPALGNVGLLIAHPGAGPEAGNREGGGLQGVGGDGEDIRLACTDPGGVFYVTTKYFTEPA